jgi:hypothetical protein
VIWKTRFADWITEVPLSNHHLQPMKGIYDHLLAGKFADLAAALMLHAVLHENQPREVTKKETSGQSTVPE